MRFDNDKDSKIRITEDGNGKFHVERNYFVLSDRQSMWPWKPLRYEERWMPVDCAPMEDWGQASTFAKEYIRSAQRKVVAENTFGNILDGVASGFGGDLSKLDDREGSAK